MINNRLVATLFIFLFFELSIFSVLHAQTTGNMSKKELKQEKKADKREKINALIKQEEEGSIIYQKQNTFGLKLYSDGWGAFFEKGYQKSVYKTNLFSLEIGERKHPKEDKVFSLQQSGGFLFGTPLIFGKQNNFFFTKLGVGQSYLIGGKGNRNGVSVSAVYKGGLSLGLLKPYYVDIQSPNAVETLSVKWEDGLGPYDDVFLGLPIGSSGLFKGFNEIQIKPGAFVQGSLRFDYGRYNEMVSALEVGFNIEYYSSNMPIMIEKDLTIQNQSPILVEPKKLFLNVFIAIEFGRRK
jgi:hypothetical protein